MTTQASTTKKSTAAYKPTVRLTAHRGWYRVQSGTDPHTWYETSANSCTCPARKPCKHQRYVRALNVAFFVKKEAEAPVADPTVEEEPTTGVSIVANTTLDAQLAEAERVLAIKSRALRETDHRSDAYAPLLREINQAERTVAALNHQAMRAA